MMGLFSRKEVEEPAPRPFDIDESTLLVLESHLEAIEKALALGDAAIRSAVRAMSDSAGALGQADLIDVHLGTRSGEEYERTFRWLAECVELADHRGDDRLVARAFWFTCHYVLVWRGNLTPGDAEDLRIGQLPRESLAKIAQAASRALEHMNDDDLLWSAPGDQITVEYLKGQLRGLT